MACPNFGNHDLVSLDVSRFDHHSRFDPITFIGMGTRTVVLVEDPVPKVPLGGLAVQEPFCPTKCTPVPVRALAMP
eukprot:10638710-Heterocapsa_arctica.AAC.1